MMENDPSKKESKGKRIFKKAIRRNSKSSNNSQNSPLESGINISRSKSFENKHLSIEINDSTPLPTPDGTNEKVEYSHLGQKNIEEKEIPKDFNFTRPSEEVKVKKVEIRENRNEIYDEPATASNKDAKSKTSPRLEKNERLIETGDGKRSLKRVCFML